MTYHVLTVTRNICYKWKGHPRHDNSLLRWGTKRFLEYTFLKFANREQNISKSEPKRIIGSAEIEVHSVADDGLNKIKDFIKKYRLSDILIFSKYAVAYCNI